MCGFLVTNNQLKSEYTVCSHLIDRGPDYSNYKNIEGINFIHTLLSLTGEFTPQPITEEGISVLFNGEIYNYKEIGSFDSDVYSIIECYKKYGLDFLNFLEGEFAIIIFDSTSNQIIFSTDIFGTKPLYYSIENKEFGFSSYKSSLEEIGFKKIKKLHANSFGVFNINEKSLKITNEYFKFNLDQFKDTYDDWNKAFIKAVEKRFSGLKQDIILPLSSGLDSGGIACALQKLNINYEIFSFYGNEHKKVLFKRLINEYLNKRKIYIKKSMKPYEVSLAQDILEKKIPNFYYGPIQEDGFLTHDGFRDRGSYGLVHILDFVKKRNSNIKILASGQGGDEITSSHQEYTLGNPNPEYFDDDLKNVFPWENFYHGTQSSYLMKEESISGGFGIEGRYPYLDKTVVQEYLNLLPELKNRHFKAPIYNFLVENNYPVVRKNSVKDKKGFNTIKENPLQKIIGLIHRRYVKR